MKYSDINFGALKAGLRDLSESKETQLHQYSGGIEGEMWVFEETVCLVFDVSGLSKVRDSARNAATIPQAISKRVDSLSKHLSRIPANLSVEELCDHPKMTNVRIEAKELLELLEAEQLRQ